MGSFGRVRILVVVKNRGVTKTFEDFSKNEAEAHCAEYVATLGARLEWFLDHVAETGGPQRTTLDRTPDSLDDLEAWVATQPPDLGASRDGVENLPSWVDLDVSVQDWGPRLLRLVDGVIAYWAECYTSRWPATEWRVHKSRRSDVDYRQPVLCDNGRGRVNLRRIVRNTVDGVIFDRESGTFRRVWETWAPKG